MWARTAFVEARLWTWEVVTGFDGVLDPLTLRRRFAEDFPSVAQSCSESSCAAQPVFREMVSFNSTDGRKHRYLVMLANESDSEKEPAKYRGRGERILPRTAMLYGCADKLMREEDSCESAYCGCSLRESCGNCRFAFLDNGWLYILVFFEGRLCHWSEEPQYNNKESVQERLGRFDVFLRNDDLFSRAEKWYCAFMDVGDVQEPERLRWLRRAGSDPFWRVRTCGKLVLPAFAAGVALLLAVSTWWNVLSGDLPGAAPEVISPAGAELPALTPPPEMRPSEEVVAQFNESEMRAPFNKENNACDLPPVRLHGVVAGRIFSASIAGASPSWYSLGDTLGPFEVVSIGKDRVQLACGGETREVRNGT
ncbi:hypothetical protein SAMN05720761_11066 [Fibrobacter sp. UWCM]|uniref:hypothetical protein n=1 Tax=Fibrobacter sp. UWCM TaxID=1896208 RepID=UPI00091978C6|nr:hypothetical protein [Fibrobacter sp. UWCM]SHH19571.1 hypothetical protein SAMN05720761_11066 [Fibrobacter sp. UWCM]